MSSFENSAKIIQEAVRKVHHIGKATGYFTSKDIYEALNIHVECPQHAIKTWSYDDQDMINNLVSYYYNIIFQTK